MERVMVTCSGDLLAAVDLVARRLGRKRSQVVREALNEWLERQRQREFEALLTEGYQALGAELAESTSDFGPLQAAATKRLWLAST